MNKNDDLFNALDYNRPENFVIEDLKDIIAEIPGANDEFSWWWILELGDGRFVLLSAWCDYTGWDCQSGIDHESIHPSAMECALAAPGVEEYSKRAIRKNLVGQLTGKYPRLTYWED